MTRIKAYDFAATKTYPSRISHIRPKTFSDFDDFSELGYLFPRLPSVIMLAIELEIVDFIEVDDRLWEIECSPLFILLLLCPGGFPVKIEVTPTARQ